MTLASCGKKDDPTPQKKPEDVVKDSAYVVRVMQFNILASDPENEGHKWHNDRKEPCLNMLRKVKPDVIALEEVRKGGVNAQDPVPNQYDELLLAFPDYTSVQFPKNGNKNSAGQRNMIMWKKSKLELVSWGKYWFSKDRTSDSSLSNMFNDPDAAQKMTVWAKFKNKATGNIFWVYCTHFFASVKYIETREKCVDISIESIRSEVGEKGTVFLCGDLNFNYLEDGPRESLQPLFNYMKWSAQEAPKTHGVRSPTYNRFGVGTPAILDYIFYRNATPINYYVEDGHLYGTYYISDHYPVYSDFLLPEK